MSEPLEEMVLKISGDVSGIKAALAEMTASMKTSAEKIGEHTGHMTESVFKAEIAVELLKKAFEKLKEGTIDLVKESMQQIDHQAKLADRLGVTTEFVAGLKIAGEELGLGLDEITSSMGRLQRGMAEAKTGAGPVHDALVDLKIDSRELAKERPEEQMKKIMDGFAGIHDQSKKAEIAVALFGRSGLQMVGFLSQGSAAMEEAQKKAEMYGTAVSRLDSAKIEQANNSWRDLKDRMEGIGNAISIAIAPALVGIAKLLDENAVSAKDFQKAAETAVDYIAQGIDGLRYMIHGLQIAWDGVKVGVTAWQLAFMMAYDYAAKGLIYVGELLGNWGRALSRTQELISQTFKTGFTLALDAVKVFVSAGLLVFSDMLLKVQEGMMKAHIKGADDVLTAANTIHAAATQMATDSKKSADDTKIAWKNAADDAAFAWKNILPDFSKIKIPFLDGLIDKYKDKLSGFAADLKQSLNAPFDGHKVRDWLELVIASVNAAAKQSADKIKESQQQTEQTITSLAQNAIQARLDGLNQLRLAEMQANADNIAGLKALFAEAGTLQVEQNALLEDEQKRHSKAMADIERGEATKRRNEEFEAQRAQDDKEQGVRHVQWQNDLHEWMDLHKQQIDDTINFFNAIGSLTESHNKKLFMIGKAAQLAGAVISTARGVANALADVPYPYNFVAAAAVGIAGAVQIAKIASTQFGGGGGGGGASIGSAPSLGGSGGGGTAPAAGVTGAAPQGQLVTIALQGAIFNESTIRGLADQLNQFVRDGGTLGGIQVQS